MRSEDYFQTHPVFTHREFTVARAASKRTTNNLLNRYVAAGRLVRVRRGLYATVPRGVSADQLQVDPYLIATKLTGDATVAYHAALQFHGKAHSIWRRFHYLTRERTRPLSFRGAQIVPVQAPRPVRGEAEMGGGVSEQRHAGGIVRVTSLERALVDVLDRPGHGGGWEEIWRSLEMVEFFDLDAVIGYAFKLGSALTVARVGFFLEQHREQLMVEEDHLEALRARAPAQPRYLDSARTPGRLVSGWNLVVPTQILERAWQEEAELLRLQARMARRARRDAPFTEKEIDKIVFEDR